MKVGKRPPGFPEIYTVYSYNASKVHHIFRVLDFLLLYTYSRSHNYHIIPPFLLVLDVKSSENSKTLVLAVVQRTARLECY